MIPIDRQQRAGSNPVPPDLTFDDVRQSFLVRLHGEATRLAVLTDSLGSSERDTESVFADLEEFAHRLRGAAAIFEAFELSADAKSLELAVAAASNIRGRRDDRFVLATLRALTARLALINGTTPSSNCLVSPAR